MTDYPTDADMIRDALSKHGPLSRSDLVIKTNLERPVIAKSLYSLKKQGHVIEEGDLLTLTKAAKMAQDAFEETEAGMGSAPESEPDIGDVSKMQDVMQKMLEEMPRQDTRPKSPDELPELVSSSLNALIADYRRVIDEWCLMKLQVDNYKGLRAENEKLREELASRNAQWDKMVRYHDAYHALKAKLRGMLDD